VAAAGGLGAFLALTGGLSWSFPLAIGVVGAWIVPPTLRQLRGNALALHGQLDEAFRVLEPLARSRLAPASYRGMARSTLAYIEACRGDHEAALAWAERGSRRVWPRLSTAYCRYARVAALVNLGRAGEARALFDRHLRDVPRGDLLRHAHWQAELYLLMAEDGRPPAADELHRRARVALGMTASRTILALLAWAHHTLGDDDQAWHLLRVALEQDDVELTERSRPRLHEWITTHREAALRAAPAE
jgi:tetratricopeptide (TPR) repeat protein